ncbi:MAG TPA: YncE family protein [Bryobacteraceae bacterium]|jgi:YVTN family beta-propeller protein|nr:YncE family protein [Bryobacteraceae bacterium]
MDQAVVLPNKKSGLCHAKSTRSAIFILSKFLLVPLFLTATLYPPARAANASGRLYVTNSLGDDITVIDLQSLKAVQDIKVGMEVHGICAPADGRRLFTTVESERNLKVIDTETGKILSVIPVTGRPNQCASTPDGRYVGVPIRDGNSVDIIDTMQRKVVKVLPVKVPHNCYNAGHNDALYVSSMGDNEIDRIDLKTMSYSEKIPVGGIPRPYAVSADEKTLYTALSDFHGFAIASIPQCKVINRIDLPPAPPSECPLEPHTPSHGLELSPSGDQLWVTSLADDRVYVYDTSNNRLLGHVLTGKCPNWITFSRDGRYCCVSNSGTDDCSIIDTRTRKEVARIKVGKAPKRLLALSH